VALHVDGDNVGQGRVEATAPMVLSGDNTTVGPDTGTGVSTDHPTPGNEFTGRIHWMRAPASQWRGSSRRPLLITLRDSVRIRPVSGSRRQLPATS
jgi:hypothetical protein